MAARRALVVYESLYGNTRDVAEAIADGLRGPMEVELVEACDAAPTVPDDVDLLVVGGPTHTFGMTRATTRADAAKSVDVTTARLGCGLREWLAGIDPPGRPIAAAAFDTRIPKPFAGSAAKQAARKLRKLGFHEAAPPASFAVRSTPGPLAGDELRRARTWGSALVGQ